MTTNRTDAFSQLLGNARGNSPGTAARPADGRPGPMSTDQVLATIRFLAPELAQRADARTKAWREGPPAAWVIAYLAYCAAGCPSLATWWVVIGEDFWAQCGLPSRPTPTEAERFFTSVFSELDDAPTTVACLAAVIADLARCGVTPVTRIDPASMKTKRATKKKGRR